MHGQTVQETRHFFAASWKKYILKQPLEALERQIVEVLLLHPEYQDIVASNQIDMSYFPELGQSNPFLHMGLHLTIRDQVATNRPAGITTIFNTLLKTYQNQHTVEHLMIEPLAECLWKAQRNQSLPDEEAYLKACEQLR